MTQEQDRALKRRSRELGVSEAEVVRRALDAALAGESASTPLAGSPIEALMANTRRLAEGRRIRGGWDRESLYERGSRS